MAQPSIIQNIESLLSRNVITEAELADAVNVKLAESGLALAGASVKVKKRAKAAKADKASGAMRGGYPDNRNNNHAILLAVKQCVDAEIPADSAAIQAKLKDMDHVLETGIFNTTKSNLTNKYSCLKATGKARSKVFTLTKAGESELERYEEAFKENGKS